MVVGYVPKLRRREAQQAQKECVLVRQVDYFSPCRQGLHRYVVIGLFLSCHRFTPLHFDVLTDSVEGHVVRKYAFDSGSD